MTMKRLLALLLCGGFGLVLVGAANAGSCTSADCHPGLATLEYQHQPVRAGE
jgi:hypothetical protein